MIVRMDASGTRLLDPTVFTDFHVEVADGANVSVPLYNFEAGTVNGETASISIPWIKAQGQLQVGEHEKWLQNLETMITFAASRGWLRDEGQSLEAHVLRV